jgi:hypothetical protein
MRVLLLMFCLMPTLSPVSARPFSEAPRRLQLRGVTATNRFDRDVEQLRAAQPHTDYYLILRFEIEVMRRENPEYSDLLDRYLERLLQSEN